MSTQLISYLQDTGFDLYIMRETGIEPATPSLARRCSTTEPLAHKLFNYASIYLQCRTQVLFYIKFYKLSRGKFEKIYFFVWKYEDTKLYSKHRLNRTLTVTRFLWTVQILYSFRLLEWLMFHGSVGATYMNHVRHWQEELFLQPWINLLKEAVEE